MGLQVNALVWGWAKYRKLVANGQQKAAFYTEETIAAIRLNNLTGPVMARYYAGQANTFAEQLRFKALAERGNLGYTVKQLAKKVLWRR